MQFDLVQAMMDACWDYHDASASERRFRGLLGTPLTSESNRLELQTQLARAIGLQRRFPEALAILDEVSGQARDGMDRVQVRLALEQGRLLNSSGDRDASRPHFRRAWDLAVSRRLDGLAVDAAHMLAIVTAPPESSAWNEKAMTLCRTSGDPVARRWRASLLNNMGWASHERGALTEALDLFEQALAARIERGTPREIQIALWCIARCLRSLGRTEEALEIQRGLAAGPAEDDEHVHKEIAECLAVLSRGDGAESTQGPA